MTLPIPAPQMSFIFKSKVKLNCFFAFLSLPLTLIYLTFPNSFTYSFVGEKDIMIRGPRNLSLWGEGGTCCHKNTQTKQQLVTNFVNGTSTAFIDN